VTSKYSHVGLANLNFWIEHLKNSVMNMPFKPHLCPQTCITAFSVCSGINTVPYNSYNSIDKTNV